MPLRYRGVLGCEKQGAVPGISAEIVGDPVLPSVTQVSPTTCVAGRCTCAAAVEQRPEEPSSGSRTPLSWVVTEIHVYKVQGHGRDSVELDSSLGSR